MPDDVHLCAWPADGHTPSRYHIDTGRKCLLPMRGHRALSPIDQTVTYDMPVCNDHVPAAAAAGWTVHRTDAGGTLVSAQWGTVTDDDGPRSVPTPMPPLFRPGQEPRGLIAPVVAYSIIGAAVGLAMAGEAWDAYRSWRNGRRALRLLRDLGVVPK